MPVEIEALIIDMQDHIPDGDRSIVKSWGPIKRIFVSKHITDGTVDESVKGYRLKAKDDGILVLRTFRKRVP